VGIYNVLFVVGQVRDEAVLPSEVGTRSPFVEIPSLFCSKRVILHRVNWMPRNTPSHVLSLGLDHIRQRLGNA